MAIFRGFGRKKRRYPVKRDETGKSARSRCFEMFEDKVPLDEIAEAAHVRIGTVYKYHQQWKKNPNFEPQHAYIKELLKKTAPDRDQTIELFAGTYGIRKEQLETILAQPHGLRRLMTGKFHFPSQADTTVSLVKNHRRIRDDCLNNVFGANQYGCQTFLERQ